MYGSRPWMAADSGPAHECHLGPYSKPRRRGPEQARSRSVLVRSAYGRPYSQNTLIEL